MTPGARKSHRGPRSNQRRAAGKPSAIRRNELFGGDWSRDPLVPIVRSKDTRTEKQKENLLRWVRSSPFLTSLPLYMSEMHPNMYDQAKANAARFDAELPGPPGGDLISVRLQQVRHHWMF